MPGKPYSKAEKKAMAKKAADAPKKAAKKTGRKMKGGY